MKARLPAAVLAALAAVRLGAASPAGPDASAVPDAPALRAQVRACLDPAQRRFGHLDG